MADTVLTYDSAGDWEAGTLLDGVIAVNPAGKLALGFDGAAVAAYVVEGALAVCIRAREGSGTNLENLGDAADGTLSNVLAWKTRVDGRNYLEGYGFSVPFHASFAIADSLGTKRNVAAGLVVWYPTTVATEVLMSRASRIIIGIDANKYAYATAYGSNVEEGTGGYVPTTVTGTSEALVAGKVYEIYAVASSQTLSLYVNGERVAAAAISGTSSHVDPGAGALAVACSGCYTNIIMFGDGTSGLDFLRQTQGGSWEKNVNLVTRHTLRKFVADCALDSIEHSVSVQIGLADSELDLEVVPAETFSLLDQPAWTYWPGEKRLLSGAWAKIRVTMSAADWFRTVPILDYLTVTFRPCVVPLIDFQMHEDAPSYESVLPLPEVAVAEDLSGLVAELRRQRVVIDQMGRQQQSIIEDVTGLGGRVAAVEHYYHGDLMEYALGVVRRYLPMPDVDVNAAVRRIDVAIGQIVNILTQVDRRAYEAWTWAKATNAAGYITAAAADTIVDGVISTAVGAGGVIDNAIDSLISTHSDLFTGVHGVSAGYRLTYDITAAPDVGLRIYALVAAGLAPGGVIDNAIDAVIATHDALAGAHGGALGIANDAHSDAATAQSRADSAYSLADAATTPSEVATLIGTHSGYATGIHGIVYWSNGNIAGTSQVSAALSAAQAAQGTADDAHSDAATAKSRADAAYTLADAAQTAAEAGVIARAEIVNHEDNRCVNYAPS